MSIFSYPAMAVILLLLLSSVHLSSLGATETPTSDYQLSVHFSVESHRLSGTARITIGKNERLTLSLFHLQVGTIRLTDHRGEKQEIHATGDMLIIPASQSERTLYVSYTREVRDEPHNLIDSRGISLTSNWYPVPEKPMVFSLTALLPENFSGVTESDRFPLAQKNSSENQVTSHFSQVTTAIHLVAGPYVMEKQKVRDGLYVYTMFFEEDRQLAPDYLQAATDYLNYYEKEFGPFPYTHYVIAANRQATGFGMPTFTLLGQAVLRLPFIISTSLGHEIVHSWFGNSVGVDYGEGNWCEGLTSYLSDYRYREQQGEGAKHRKESIIKYLSYVHPDTAIPLSHFTSASHSQPMARARRAVGYSRGALFFHELRQRIGEQPFTTALRQLYSRYRGKTASWTDLRLEFEQASSTDLSRFFKQRLNSTDIPSLVLEDIAVTHIKGRWALNFTLLQNSDKPFSLRIPLRITTISSSHIVHIDVEEVSTPVSIPLDERPLKFTVDPAYDFLRQLDDQEMVPVWSRFLGAEDKLIILAEEKQREIYRPILELFKEDDVSIVTADSVANSQLSSHSLLFLGLDQAPLQSILAGSGHVGEGFTLDVRDNPLLPGRVAVLISSSSISESQAVARRLQHYGRYSFVKFHKGRKIKSRIDSSVDGMRYILEQLPQGASTSSLDSFNSIVDELLKNRVIYIGETHTSLSDHLLQLRIIEALYNSDQKLAIGMEMFPTSSQKALDSYILGDGEVDEKAFLRQSGYFTVWRYDYRLLRDILSFAKNHDIPVIGLNLDRKIVSQVFREGGTDGLSEQIAAELPADRDLGMEGYVERLSRTHNMHLTDNHATGSISGFIQSQGLWDEGMAAHIVSFLQSHPDHRMVVLAGAQHTRKDSGIPPRVKRRMNIAQASVINLHSTTDMDDLQQLADYVFLAGERELAEQPKIGVVLAPAEYNQSSVLKIVQLSPHGKAGEAGLLEEDILLEINGENIDDMADLQIAMLDTEPGDTIELKISRREDNQDTEQTFRVELSLLPVAPPHP